jgi:8-hydroxy-5-deazaflavin:NADPH oxidoreductase
VPRATQFASLAEQVKSITQGPVAKSFNLNFASLFDQIAHQRVRPTSFYAADDEARDVTERLISDAGYDPAFVGGLDKARALEDLGWLPASAKGGMPVFYRFAEAGEL